MGLSFVATSNIGISHLSIFGQPKRARHMQRFGKHIRCWASATQSLHLLQTWSHQSYRPTHHLRHTNTTLSVLSLWPHCC